MTGYHRLHETESEQVFNRYSKMILDARTVDKAKCVLRYAGNCCKLSKDDFLRLELLSITRQQELKGVKLSYSSKISDEKPKKVRYPLVTKKMALERSKCPQGSFVHVISKAGYNPVKSKIINGRYTYFYDARVVDVLIDKYGVRNTKKD
jgi:hypothetical protein